MFGKQFGVLMPACDPEVYLHRAAVGFAVHTHESTGKGVDGSRKNAKDQYGRRVIQIRASLIRPNRIPRGNASFGSSGAFWHIYAHYAMQSLIEHASKNQRGRPFL